MRLCVCMCFLLNLVCTCVSFGTVFVPPDVEEVKTLVNYNQSILVHPKID